MKLNFKKGAMTALLAATIGTVSMVPAHSQTAPGSVPFRAEIYQVTLCLITVDPQAGIIVPSADSTQLSSQLPGGRPGRVEVRSIRPYEIYVSDPPFFDNAPPGGNVNTTVRSFFSGTSVQNGVNFGPQAGSVRQQLNGGFSITDVEVNVVASKPDGFPPGSYSVFAVIRCE